MWIDTISLSTGFPLLRSDLVTCGLARFRCLLVLHGLEVILEPVIRGVYYLWIATISFSTGCPQLRSYLGTSNPWCLLHVDWHDSVVYWLSAN